jgi:carboxypeptidase A
MKLIIFVTLLGVALASKARFDNYKVYRITVENEEMAKVLQHLENHNPEYMFWETASNARQAADLVVPPHKLPEFEDIMAKYNMKAVKLADNLQSLIDNEHGTKTYSADAEFGWDDYYPLNKMYEWMDKILAKYPNIVTGFTVGTSYEGRVIRGIKISYKPGNKGVFIESNIHAREWVTSASATWIANELLTSKDPVIRDVAENVDWYVLPVANPDGFEFTHTSNRMWRKTRMPSSEFCWGADPNRNFGHLWMTGGASDNPCSDTYAGHKAFSEPETKALADFYLTIEKNIVAYVDFHSFSQLLMYPYGSTQGGRINNEQEHIEVGKAMQKKLSERFGTKYQFGNIVTTIYVASGGSIDWIKGVPDTPFVFVYEMRDTGRYGFILPAKEIIPNAQETIDSLVEMIKQLRIKGYLKSSN